MKKVMSIMLVVFMVLPSVAAFAGEVEDPITGTVKTVGRAAQGTLETAVSPMEALGKGEPANVVADPVQKGGETVAKTAENIGKTVTFQEVE